VTGSCGRVEQRDRATEELATGGIGLRWVGVPILLFGIAFSSWPGRLGREGSHRHLGRAPLPPAHDAMGVVFASVGGQFVGGGLSGVGGAAQKVSEQFELVVAVAGADLVHGGVHPRVEAEQLRGPVAPGPHEHGAAV
jgi:hypothetical protein